MIIQPTSLAAMTWAGAATGAAAESWRVGSVLPARSLGMGEQGRMVLQIGALTVETDPLGVPLPSQFQVRVLAMGNPPLLEILAQGAGDPLVQRALRERLPQQNGYASLLATLGALAQRPVLRQLPPDIRAALAQLDQGVRTPQDITHAEGLREAVVRSGLFLESQLARPQTNPLPLREEDWKGTLLRLAALLDRQPRLAQAAPPAGADTPPPLRQRGLQAQPRATAAAPRAGESPDAEDVDRLLGRLKSDVHAALARLEIAQLDAAAGQAWMIEIPLQGAHGRDVLQIHLEYGQDGETGSPQWTLGFALDLPALGPLQGELQLRDLRLNVRLWAERSASAERLERQFTPLRQRLAASGLQLDQLTCQTGLPHGNGQAGALLLKATA
ncbi:flagellar hook-length control protein FliK [Fulvimonas yonginensis]|uniref:Flagellar hook-length control protein FliK n=1 Tax=Fulvimonas yonginensis TaxID=1495200 RepID=A0ABU8J8Z9_9GAMM